jgi:hypothetical protein
MMKPIASLLLLASSCLLSLVPVARSAEPLSDPAGIEFFEKKIRPALVLYCYECHSAASVEVKGELRLDSRPAMLSGGESGPAIIPRKPNQSLLISALKHESLEMPPGKKLPEAIVRDFHEWIQRGAPDPRKAPAEPEEVARQLQQATFAERLNWWSLQPVQEGKIPRVQRHSSAHPVDRFIQSALRQQGLSQAPRADQLTLLRRLSFTLTGLPPGQAQVQAFLEDFSADAWENAVERLLASDHFGEHWARHWMDVVRYTDTYGYEWDVAARGAWRYRDYLVRAFNKDIPYDQLVREQVAGDLLTEPRLNHELGINESLIGPMFYQLGEKRHGDSSEFNGVHQEMLDNKIDAFSKALLATTISCARCHDHKRDPITQQEYYALAGAILSSRWITNTVDLPERNRDVTVELQKLKKQLRQQLADQWLAETGKLNLEQLAALPADEKAPMEDTRYAWQKLQAAGDSTEQLVTAWKALSETYGAESVKRVRGNSEKFTLVADLREQIPGNWAVDGSGTRQRVGCGDFRVSLSGEKAIEPLTLGGILTASVSSRLNGALRSPYLSTIEDPFLSIQVAGGDFAAHRTVIDNAFLTEKQVYLVSPVASWQQFSTFPTMRERHIFLEYVTKTSNPNFPPRVGLGGATTAEQEADPRSWFCVSRILSHKQAGSPADELHRFADLLAGDSPTSLEQVRDRFRSWFGAAIDRWKQDTARDEDITIINWLMEQKWISNRRDLPGVKMLLSEYQQLEATVQVPHTVNGLADLDPGFDYRLNIRGDYNQLGESVPRGAPRSLTPGGENQFTTVGSGRLQLARIVASPDHPLTARIYVNRTWQWLFGSGIVATPSDFGQLGQQPSHPELLDWLTYHFVQRGWSTKELIRLILSSQTWQQAGQVTEKGLTVDPENRLLHHYPLRRLEAESIRDAILAVSGRLEPALYGPTTNPPRANEDGQKRLFSGPLDGNGRRSIYTRITIMEPPRFLALFNQPKPKIPTGRRDSTNTPSQSLALLNDPFVISMAKFWANQMVTEDDDSIRGRIGTMFQRAYGRAADKSELERWQHAVMELAGLHEVAGADILKSELVWQDIAHAIFNTKEFIYIK